MGNQMFQYAAGRAISLKHQVPLKLDLTFLLDRTVRPGFVFRDFDLDVFKVSAEIASPADIPFRYRKHFRGRSALRVDRERQRFFPGRGTERGFEFNESICGELEMPLYLEGHWQSYKYFSACEEQIRADFELKTCPPADVMELAAFISDEESVCVNVRRTDYVNSPVHGVLGTAYISRALEIVTAGLSRPRIYIFSDDLAWCRENLKLGLDSRIVGPEFAGPKFQHYLFLMKACRHFVIPNSTFAWWAAWLSGSSDKIVVAPKQWFRSSATRTEDLIPETWVRV